LAIDFYNAFDLLPFTLSASEILIGSVQHKNTKSHTIDTGQARPIKQFTVLPAIEKVFERRKLTEFRSQ